MWEVWLRRNWQWISLAGVILIVSLGLVWINVTHKEASATKLASKPMDKPLPVKKSVSKQLVIDVKGGVVRPGIYYFVKAPTVAQVVATAGGFDKAVRTERLNLAAKMADQTVLFIPLGDADVPAEFPLPGVQVKESAGANFAKSNLININQANKAELMNLTGIGAKRAEDIINYRNGHGNFKEKDELKLVHGIGEKIFERISSQITI
ncbi:late competence protein [Weissella oryzae SG25]|uniref:Late competence protein n=1 Tax=Weissella oryzae (strain DSM 25784 / JCM 18191 / LMG 30913 / SG25) TaxID=1329250 RepID=A0A069CVR2_WEIOS|nr:helix-hairpin-helix domain-containing protein [Weissella oryzae]GAK31278.1 late competence protein [Weissella oryzae SG25]